MFLLLLIQTRRPRCCFSKGHQVDLVSALMKLSRRKNLLQGSLCLLNRLRNMFESRPLCLGEALLLLQLLRVLLRKTNGYLCSLLLLAHATSGIATSHHWHM